MVRDTNDSIYKTGLKLDYTANEINFFPEFAKEDVYQMACGRKHYVVLSKNN